MRTWLHTVPAAIARSLPHEGTAALHGVAAAGNASGSHADRQPALAQRTCRCGVGSAGSRVGRLLRYTAAQVAKSSNAVHRLDPSTVPYLMGCPQTRGSMARGPQGPPGRRQTQGRGRLQAGGGQGVQGSQETATYLQQAGVWCAAAGCTQAQLRFTAKCSLSLTAQLTRALVNTSEASLPPRLCPLVASCCGSTRLYSGLALSLACAATHCR